MEMHVIFYTIENKASPYFKPNSDEYIEDLLGRVLVGGS